MRELYEKVHNNDSASVHIETANDASLTGTAATAAQQQAWITIAAANVFPEVIILSIQLKFAEFEGHRFFSGSIAPLCGNCFCSSAEHQPGDPGQSRQP